MVERALNSDKQATRIVIVGGGTAGWMTAAGISSLLPHLDITLIESAAIPTIGVGEATLPHLRFFNQTIGLDEKALMAETRATVKLGIEFCDWGKIGDRYIHPFGDFGMGSDGLAFHQIWHSQKDNAGSIFDYSLPCVAAREGRFEPPSNDVRSVNSTYRWAYQFDATLYAPVLRRHAEHRKVKRIEARVVDVELADDGDIAAVKTACGRTISGDLFIDCSGFRALLIEQALKTGFDDWSHWLPVDRAVAVACEHSGPVLPYTRATAREAGWQWRIPLQHRTGNGYVYASDALSDQDAQNRLEQTLEGDPIAQPRLLRFKTGKRRSLWHRNCVAIGLSGGFLEPLESTSIYLIQQGITYLMELFPTCRNKSADRVRRTEYNRLIDLEFDRIRDFLILHYRASQRDDTAFWRHMRHMTIPDSLQEQMDLFQARGRVATYDVGLFLEPSWVAVYLGQGIVPEGRDSRANQQSEEAVRARMEGLRQHIAQTAQRMPTHADWISANCAMSGEAAA